MMAGTSSMKEEKMPINHPLKVGTRVKYLAPSCPCSGSRWKLTEGVIQHVDAKKKNSIIYGMRGQRHKIPAKGVVELV